MGVILKAYVFSISRIRNSGCGGVGFGVANLGVLRLKVWGLGLRMSGSRVEVLGLGMNFGLWGRFRIWGLRVRG